MSSNETIPIETVNSEMYNADNQRGETDMGLDRRMMKE